MTYLIRQRLLLLL